MGQITKQLLKLRKARCAARARSRDDGHQEHTNELHNWISENTCLPSGPRVLNHHRQYRDETHVNEAISNDGSTQQKQEKRDKTSMKEKKAKK